ncbi:MAG: ATP-dependent Clp protease ATP-binding subunit [Lachnospiraceae bacterium]|jgi:ATP-dependent Clp protease ATP-binding subunit ClpC|nr:ATP-dependent Clp protease ATP-binding subunit [Lachnospiraceae bacterium]
MNYTEQANDVLKLSEAVAKELNHPYIGTEHLLLSLRKVYSGVAGQVLAAYEIDEATILKVMESLVSPGESYFNNRRPKYSPRLSFILEESEEEALRLDSESVGTEHMLLAIIMEPDCVAARILLTLNVNLRKMTADIYSIIGESPRMMASEDNQNGPMYRRNEIILEQFATDLTAKAREGKLEPVIGRDAEIRRLMQVLSRKTKNNPCLVGEPGVGKTAVVEGLAARLASGLVPESMQDKRILTIDLAGMVAGTTYRGEFEERLKKLQKEVIAEKNVILFMDEVHTLIGAGAAKGSMDASNILKPSLSRGEIQLIGATTLSEYRKYIEKDAALERRFQPITVEEPNIPECLEIMRGLKEKYEEHHRVTIDDESLNQAVKLSKRYINDRFLPDKAIDVLDEACARVSLGGFGVPEHMLSLEDDYRQYTKGIEEALKDGDVLQASAFRHKQQDAEKKINKLREKTLNAEKDLRVTPDTIALVVSEWTKVPVQKIAESESVRLKNLEKILEKRVLGQEEAVSKIAKAIRRGRAGIKDPKKPIGSYLFLGPTGVGKTELSKALTEAMFGNEDAMIRIDMSEYMEKYNVSKMIGSAPGYVGYEEGGQLTEMVRRRPYSVVLFDEIEKAHPDVFNILLQVLDDGHITDAHGRKVDFKNTIIIMTSNAGANVIMEPKKLGFNAKADEKADYNHMKEQVLKEIKLIFKPEFLNRIDEILVFHALNGEQMKKIVGLLCRDFVKRAKEQANITVKISESVKKHIVEKGTDQKFGARPLKRAVQSMLEDKLAEELIDGSVINGDTVTAKLRNKEIIFDVTPNE